MAEDELGLPIPVSDPTTDPFSEEYIGEEAADATSDTTPDNEVDTEGDKTEAGIDEAPVDAEQDTPPEVDSDTDTGDDKTEDETPAEKLPPLLDADKQKAADEAYVKTTQAAYTRGQQELAETKRQLQMAQQVAEQQAQAQAQQFAAMQQEMAQLRAMQLAQLEEINPEQAAQVRAQQAEAQTQAQQLAQQNQLAASQAQMQAQIQEQQANAEISNRLNEFYSAHPDARGHEDEIADVVRSFDTLGDGWGIDLYQPGSLEIAYEIAKEPTLRQQLINLDLAPDSMRAIEVARAVGDDQQLAIAIRANPAYGATDEALAVARQLLAAPALSKAQDEATAAAKAKAEAARKAAEVEPGNAGTSDEAPGDEWDALTEWKKESKPILDFAQ